MSAGANARGRKARLAGQNPCTRVFEKVFPEESEVGGAERKKIQIDAAALGNVAPGRWRLRVSIELHGSDAAAAPFAQNVTGDSEGPSIEGTIGRAPGAGFENAHQSLVGEIGGTVAAARVEEAKQTAP
jgi:hypothetical protein